MQNFLRQGGMKPKKLINTYKYRKGLKLGVFSSLNAKFPLARERVTPQVIYLPG